LLSAILRGWQGSDGKSKKMLLCKHIGEGFRDRLELERLRTSRVKADRAAYRKVRKKPGDARKYLKSDWSAVEVIHVGHWLWRCAIQLECFEYDERKLPKVTDAWHDRIVDLQEELTWRDPVMMPHLKPPPAWTSWEKHYDDRLRKTFVRDWQPETQAAIGAAFERGNFEHADGVNALRLVPYTVDECMVGLVESRGRIVLYRPGDGLRKCANDYQKLTYDIQTARWLIANGPEFYLDYNCDFRGRVYATSHFHFGREDHVRSMFRLKRGERLGPGDIQWLEIHCANSEGSTDKAPWSERLKWVADNRSTIQKIANDPDGTFDLWKEADKPFCFVAACRELAAAWAHPNDFVTHLPVTFDGSCNGIQHLAMLARDEDAARRVNLIHSDLPQDIYRDVAMAVKTAIRTDSDPHAEFWREQFAAMDDRTIRKILKRPVMTYPYNVTAEGATLQIAKEYKKLKRNVEPPKGAYGYLAKMVAKETADLIPKVEKLKDHIGKLAEILAGWNRCLEWTTPTGFPVGNRYYVPNVKTAYLLGGAVKNRVADGHKPEVLLDDAVNAAVPNYVHSMDAAHLIRVVLAATNEGINDLTVVHDSFGCLATRAKRYGQIIRRELVLMYCCQDHISDLRDRNGLMLNNVPQPGNLDPLAPQDAEYNWM
jgi:DNA-directed RNA polymerase